MRTLARFRRFAGLRGSRAAHKAAPVYELFLVRKPDHSGWWPLMVRKADASGFESFQVKRNG